ncbi:MAG: alpha/beta hydrolase family esterase [Polyangiaceae bacterium]
MNRIANIALALSIVTASPAAWAQLTTVSSFGTNPAQLTMDTYVPQGMPSTPRPLVVALHGCTQTPQIYTDTGWDQLADQWKFYVLYPAQNTTVNNDEGCFNWAGRWPDAPNDFVSSEALDLTTIQRGNSENESIKEMVDQMKATYPIDASRVFVTGLSGGGGMAALMLADWPDVFAGGAIIAGIPYGCATIKATTAEAQACTQGYTGANAYLDRTAQAWGDLVRSAYTGYSGPYPRVSIWQGTADTVVSPDNEAELVKQWTDVNGIGQTATSNDTVETFPHAVYADTNGLPLVETYTITGAQHGAEVATTQPIDPNMPNGAKCGQAGSYIIDVGICSTYYAARFFGLDPSSPLPGSDGGTGSSGDGGGGTSGSSDGGVVIVPGGGGPDGGIAAVDAAPVPDDASPAAATDEDPGLPDNCAATASPSSPRGPLTWLAWGGAGLALLARRRQRARRGR